MSIKTDPLLACTLFNWSIGRDGTMFSVTPVCAIVLTALAVGGSRLECTQEALEAQCALLGAEDVFAALPDESAYRSACLAYQTSKACVADFMTTCDKSNTLLDLADEAVATFMCEDGMDEVLANAQCFGKDDLLGAVGHCMASVEALDKEGPVENAGCTFTSKLQDCMVSAAGKLCGEGPATELMARVAGAFVTPINQQTGCSAY